MRHYYQVKEMLDNGTSIDDIAALTGATEDEIRLISLNVDVESRMRGDGMRAYNERQEKLAARNQHLDMDIHMKKLRELLKPSAMSITESLFAQSKGRPHIAVKVLKNEDPFMLALTTIRIMIMGNTSGKTAVTAMCSRVAHSVAPHITDPEECFRIGFWLLRDVCLSSNGHFEMVKVPGGEHMVYHVLTTEAYIEWEQENSKLLGEVAVFARPTVIPPKPWSGLHDGGFYHEKMVNPFIRNNKKATARTHGPRAIPLVYEAVNKIQATGYVINSIVYETAAYLKEHESVYFKGFYEHLPTIEEYSRVPITMAKKAREERIKEIEKALSITKKAREAHGVGFGAWVKRQMKRIKEAHPKYKLKVELEKLRHERQVSIGYNKLITSRASKNRVVDSAMGLAAEYVKYSAFYFPHNLDWRGRVYPMTSGLTTQGTTLQKALLKFDSGVALSASSDPEAALDWLLVHTANSYGLDKSSWQDRIKWTKENTELIKRVAADPIGNLQDWTDKKVDSPWLFLAACEQMCKVYEHGLDAVIDIPIPMDGTCNGAQHYAAMTRDTHGAFGVNVAPNGTQGLKERIAATRSKLGNPKVTQGDQKLTMELNDSIKQIIQ